MAHGRGRVILPLAPPLARACSPHTGIVRSLEACLFATTEPPVFRVAGSVGRGRGLLGSSLDHLTGVGGAGSTLVEAASSAVGEALERYSATYVPNERLIVATASELGDEAVAPERFALFSERQYASAGFPFERFTRDTRVSWVRGWSVADDRPAWLPAELVFLGDVVHDGRRIGHATSSGAACAATVDEALVPGASELLERDAFMIVWANRLSLPLLDIGRDEELLALDRRLFAATGLQHAAVDLSAFHDLPIVLGVVHAPVGCSGALGVGAGTAASLVRAWWKALVEAFGARAAGAKLALVRTERPSWPDGIVTFEEHIVYHADHTRSSAAAFLDESRDRVDPASVPRLEGDTPTARVAALGRRVEAAGSSLYAVDVTSPDVRELGLVVVKAVAPELVPLDVAHAARHLGSRRLYDAPVQLGLRDEPLDETTLNTVPHPFP
jgi:ribosomal protein S12 methylthiotransferase accessory factor